MKDRLTIPVLMKETTVRCKISNSLKFEYIDVGAEYIDIGIELLEKYLEHPDYIIANQTENQITLAFPSKDPEDNKVFLRKWISAGYDIYPSQDEMDQAIQMLITFDRGDGSKESILFKGHPYMMNNLHNGITLTCKGNIDRRLFIDELAKLVDNDIGVPWYDEAYRNEIDCKVRKEG